MGAIAMTRARATRTLAGDNRGTTAVEFALVGSVLFTISFGVIDLGMILWTQGSLQAVAADAARCGAISATGCTTSDGVRSFVTTQAGNWIMGAVTSNLTVNINSGVNTATCPTIATGTYETVQITTTYLSSWLPPPFGSYSINVCASYAM
jgi:Flp pilus assembly protein TadG